MHFTRERKAEARAEVLYRVANCYLVCRSSDARAANTLDATFVTCKAEGLAKPPTGTY